MCSNFPAKFGEILSLLFLKILETFVIKSERTSVKLHSHAEDSSAVQGTLHGSAGNRVGERYFFGFVFDG